IASSSCGVPWSVLLLLADCGFWSVVCAVVPPWSCACTTPAKHSAAKMLLARRVLRSFMTVSSGAPQNGNRHVPRRHRNLCGLLFSSKSPGQGWIFIAAPHARVPPPHRTSCASDIGEVPDGGADHAQLPVLDQPHRHPFKRRTHLGVIG